MQRSTSIAALSIASGLLCLTLAWAIPRFFLTGILAEGGIDTSGNIITPHPSGIAHSLILVFLLGGCALILFGIGYLWKNRRTEPV